MGIFFKWNMFFTSFLPLWISIIVSNLFDIYTKYILDKEYFLNSIRENNISLFIKKTILEFNIEITVIFVLIFFILMGVCNISLKIKSNEKSNNKNQCKIIKARRNNNLTADFLLTYAIPMFTFDFTSVKSIILFLVYFSILSFLCIRNNNIYINMLLELKGYKMYDCDIECKLMNSEVYYENCLFISKNNLLHKINKNVNYFDFDNYIYIDIGEENE